MGFDVLMAYYFDAMGATAEHALLARISSRPDAPDVVLFREEFAGILARRSLSTARFEVLTNIGFDDDVDGMYDLLQALWDYLYEGGPALD